MKDRKKRMGILVLALALVFGFTMTGCRVFNDVHKVSYYLSLAKTVGRSEKGPVPLSVRINLDENWENLVKTINGAGVPVNLDISRCSMTTTEFDPGKNGTEKIVILKLPDSITRIVGDFTVFPNLASVYFPASTDIGEGNCFTGCSSLTFKLKGRGDLSAIENNKALVRSGNELVSYPSAKGSVTLNNITSIGRSAFFETAVESINFPAVTSVGIRAFRGCEELATVNLSSVTTIGDEAFFGNSSLETLNIPGIVTIGNSVLSSTGNTDLNITVGQKIETIGTDMFNGVRGRKNVIVKTSQSEVEEITAIRDAFRGRGWKENSFASWNINGNINLTVEGN